MSNTNLLFFLVSIGGFLFFLWRIIKERHTSKIDTQPPEQSTDKESARGALRAKQLAALKAAVPAGPPERMRATIQLNQYKKARIKQQRIRRFMTEDNFAYVEIGEDISFSVDMILELSETERAIIKQYELDDIVLEEHAAHTADQLAEIKSRYAEEIESTRDPLLKKIREQTTEQALGMMKNDRKKTRIGDLLVSPFSRAFDSPHEASEYADKLKTKFLPEIRKLLDRYSGRKQTETLTF